MRFWEGQGRVRSQLRGTGGTWSLQENLDPSTLVKGDKAFPLHFPCSAAPRGRDDTQLPLTHLILLLLEMSTMRPGKG